MCVSLVNEANQQQTNSIAEPAVNGGPDEERAMNGPAIRRATSKRTIKGTRDFLHVSVNLLESAVPDRTPEVSATPLGHFSIAIFRRKKSQRTFSRTKSCDDSGSLAVSPPKKSS